MLLNNEQILDDLYKVIFNKMAAPESVGMPRGQSAYGGKRTTGFKLTFSNGRNKFPVPFSGTLALIFKVAYTHDQTPHSERIKHFY
jgi:hypothetical protein